MAEKPLTPAKVAEMGLAVDERDCIVQHRPGMKLHRHIALPAQPATPTPTLDRLSAADDQRRAVLDFIEWLNEHGIHLAVWWEPTYETLEGPFGNQRPVTRKMAPELTYTHERSDDLVMRWLGIDPADVERERRALLDAVRP